ncbi:lysM domain receptor-like kinase 4 [Durio zibethinus]|uniref:LysM domain receptor-like kinase 4 n=1 Tax=Durio zibethinus TaxID=66656 RepID=A0A6P5ZTZ0_DURZI|nr:lysM domain receptor-like kinase 4 [Durio zibethinus]
MVSLHKLISFCILVLLIKPMSSQQSYDESNCTAESQVQGSNYLCTPEDFPCDTYIVYRAQKDFQSMSSISSLFNLSVFDLLEINHMTEANSSNLKLRREIIIPLECSCAGSFFQSIFLYLFLRTDSFASVACGVFEGLLKAQSLKEENPDSEHNVPGDFMIKVPIRCACPNSNQRKNGVTFLVTYPVIENDHTNLIASKFGVPEEVIWDANKLQPFPTIFPLTTLLVPTKDVPVVNSDVPEDLPSSPRVASPLVKIEPSNKKSKHLSSYIFLGLGVLAVVILLIAAVFAFRSIRKRRQPTSFQLLSARSSVSSNVSPDFLDRMSKLKQSLTNFSLEELSNATEDFNEGCMIGKAVYRGEIGGSYVAIEQMNTEEEARHVIYILTKISHVNIVKLEGCYSGTNPYLVYEFAEYGSLRDCLSNVTVARQLKWAKRTQIAFDLAVGLHYIHYCTKPSFIHHNIHSRNVLITTDCRAKITGFRLAKPVICSEEIGEISWNESIIVGRKGYLAPEYLTYSLASLKVDVFAFGVVLLELLSAKEADTDGELLKDSVNILEDVGIECSSGYLEKLKEFMDPNLEGDYPMADAICFLFLAKACLDQDPHHRPTMDNVTKALSRFV